MDLFHNLAVVYARLDEAERALELLQEVLRWREDHQPEAVEALARVRAFAADILRDLGRWDEATALLRQSLDSVANKRRPIREQLGLRDRIAAEVTTQKTKATMAMEKLQVEKWCFCSVEV